MREDFYPIEQLNGKFLIRNRNTGFYVRRADLTYMSFDTKEEAQEYIDTHF